MSSPYADFPEVDVVDPTDSTGYGSDTMSEICKILNGKILGNRRPHIKSPWIWQGPLTLEAQTLPPDPETGDYALAVGQVNIYADPTTGRVVVQKSTGQVVELENIISLLQDLTNVSIVSVANGDALRYNSTTTKWENTPFPSGLGEANTASNVGTAGVGVWKQKTGVNLEFKKIFGNSAKITVTDDTANSRISLDVIESALTIANLSGNLTVPRGGTGASTLTGILKGNGTAAVTAAAQLAVADGGTGVATLSSGSYIRGAGTSAVTTQAIPIPVAHGGTGKTSITTGALLAGAGASAPTEIAVGTNGQVLTMVTGAPAWAAATGGGGGGTGLTGPSTGKKVGSWTAQSAATGSGILSGIIGAPTGSPGYILTLDNSGLYGKYEPAQATGNTSYTKSTILFTRRFLNPWVQFKLMLNDITSCRPYLGFTGDVSTDPVNNNYSDNDDVFMFNLQQNGTNWQIAHNNNSSVGLLDDTGVAAVNNTWVTIDLKADETNARWQWAINGGAFNNVTTQVPGQTTNLGLVWGLQTVTGSGFRPLNVLYVDYQQDK